MGCSQKVFLGDWGEVQNLHAQFFDAGHNVEMCPICPKRPKHSFQVCWVSVAFWTQKTAPSVTCVTHVLRVLNGLHRIAQLQRITSA